METRFSELNLWPVERFAAVDGTTVQIPERWPESPGAYGCLQSHLAVVLQARALNRESVLIMEDDILFDERFHEKVPRTCLRLCLRTGTCFFSAVCTAILRRRSLPESQSCEDRFLPLCTLSGRGPTTLLSA